MLEETTILIDDLKLVRNALAASLQYHQATDIANAQCNMAAVRYRPLTNTLDGALERINGILGDWLLTQHLDEPLTEAEPAEEEEELDPNPLGTVKFKSQIRRTALSGKHLGFHDGMAPEEHTDEPEEPEE